MIAIASNNISAKVFFSSIGFENLAFEKTLAKLAMNILTKIGSFIQQLSHQIKMLIFTFLNIFIIMSIHRYSAFNHEFI